MKTAIPLMIFIGLLVFLGFGLGRDAEYVPSPLIGKPVPVFELATLQDPAVNISTQQLLGRAYALNVWGSWCAACKDEHEVLMQVAKDGVIPLVGFNWKDTRASATRWIKMFGDPYELSIFDPVGDVAIDFGVYGAPETFLVNEKGQIIHKHIGPLTYQIWQQDFLSRVETP